MSALRNSIVATTTLAIAVGLFLVAFSWHVDFSNLLSDSGIYLLLASKFSPAQSIPEPLFELIMTEYHLPPGYSLALALFGAGAHHPTISYVVNALFLTAGITAYFVWIRSNGLPLALAYASAILLTLLPATLYYSLEILSEHLYLPLSLLALLFIQRLSEDPRPYIAAILVGLAIMTRSIGIALLPALMLAAYRLDRGMTWKVLAIALVLPVVWFLYKSQFGAGNYIHSFLQGQAGHDLFSYLWQRVSINLQLLWQSWQKSLDLIGLGPTALVSAVILVVAALQWLKRLYRLHADAVYIVCYLCIILVWPHGSHMQRFLFPLLPLFLFYAVKFSYDFSARYEPTARSKLIPCAVLATALILALPTHARVVSRTIAAAPEQMGVFSRSQQWLFAPDAAMATDNSVFLDRLYTAIRQSGSISTQDCVWSIDPPRHMLLSLRASYIPPSPKSDPDEFLAQLQRCSYVFAMNVKPHPNPIGYPGMYPSDRLPPTAAPLQTMMNSDGRLVSVLYRLADAQ